MSASTSERRKRTWRTLSLLLVTMGLGMTTLSPARAVEAGAGAATGTEDEIDSGDPTPVEGSKDTGILLCARAQDGDFDTTTNGVSAQYTLDATGTYTAGTTVFAGAITITIATDATFYFGPQGTHHGGSGNDCSTSNLGPLGKIPATVTVSGLDNAGPCTSTSGSFWRAAGNAFGAEWTATCTVDGTAPGAPQNVSVTSTQTFAGNLQPPCGLPVACLTGVYTQQ